MVGDCVEVVGDSVVVVAGAVLVEVCGEVEIVSVVDSEQAATSVTVARRTLAHPRRGRPEVGSLTPAAATRHSRRGRENMAIAPPYSAAYGWVSYPQPVERPGVPEGTRAGWMADVNPELGIAADPDRRAS